MSEELIHLEQLLSEFKQLPDLEEQYPTLLEIAGYPHYEEVCSNILAFYFDTSECHDLDNLLLRSLWECCDKPNEEAFTEETVEVLREVTTNSQKRIDLLVETDSYCFVIENKVYAKLYNDLADYGSYSDTYSSVKESIKIVLSLNPIARVDLTDGFINVTYSELFESLQKHIGFYLKKGHVKYIQYLIDFMGSVQNLKGVSMNQEIIQFFKENKRELDKLFDYKKEIDRELYNRTKQIKELINELGNNVDQWIYRKNTLVHDITLPDDITVAVDYEVGLGITELEIFIRDEEFKGDLSLLKRLKILKNSSFNTSLEKDKIKVKSDDIFNFESAPHTIAEHIKRILDEIRIYEE